MRKILVCVFLLFCACGCGPKTYRSTIKVLDPNGVVLNQYMVESNAPAYVYMKDGPVKVGGDTRVEGLIDSLVKDLSVNTRVGDDNYKY